MNEHIDGKKQESGYETVDKSIGERRLGVRSQERCPGSSDSANDDGDHFATPRFLEFPSEMLENGPPKICPMFVMLHGKIVIHSYMNGAITVIIALFSYTYRT